MRHKMLKSSSQRAQSFRVRGPMACHSIWSRFELARITSTEHGACKASVSETLPIRGDPIHAGRATPR
jgi:hypothetical protein